MNRRLWTASLATFAIAALASPLHADLVLPRPSPNATVKRTVGTTDLTVTYSRPGVKNRKIWGELVPYDKEWRTGANEATTFTTTTDITFGGQKLPAGTYGVVTGPTAQDWTVVPQQLTSLWGTNLRGHT